MTTIASPHNPGLKTLRRLRTKRGRAQSGRFFAEGEDLIAAAAAAGCAAIEGYRVAGSRVGGARFHDVEPEAAGGGLDAWLGHARDRRLRAALAAGARRARVRVPARGARSRQRRRGDQERAGLRRRVRGARRRLRGPVLAEGGAGQHGSDLRGPARARRTIRHSCPASGWRSWRGPASGSPLCRSGCARAQAVSLLVGAERAGIEPAALAACQHVAHIPIATDSLNAAMAATVALYELTRARASAPAPRSRGSGEEHRADCAGRCPIGGTGTGATI